MIDIEKEITDYGAHFKTPKTSNPQILAAFKMAARAITFKAIKANYKGDYVPYMDRITDLVDTLMQFENLTDAKKEQLAIMVYVGTAIDYKKTRPEEVEAAIQQFDLPDPHAVKMFNWAFDPSQLSGLSNDLKIITTAWLLSDAENHADYLGRLPDALKILMKSVHQKNYNNTLGLDLPHSISQRLQPAIYQILGL